MLYSPNAIGSVYWLYKQKLGNLPPLESDEDEVKEGKKNQNFDSKQTINQTSNITSTNKSWK